MESSADLVSLDLASDVTVMYKLEDKHKFFLFVDLTCHRDVIRLREITVEAKFIWPVTVGIGGWTPQEGKIDVLSENGLIHNMLCV